MLLPVINDCEGGKIIDVAIYPALMGFYPTLQDLVRISGGLTAVKARLVRYSETFLAFSRGLVEFSSIASNIKALVLILEQ